MRLPRMTTRRWMIAVAIVAPVMAVVAQTMENSRLAGLRWRHDTFSSLAKSYRDREAGLRQRSQDILDFLDNRKGYIAMGALFEVSREAAARYAKVADYYAELGQKYEKAARYPWLHVEPAPPEPK